jgi:hypothetical protein
MMVTVIAILTFSLSVLSFAPEMSPRPIRRVPQEQLHFSAEEEIQTPVSLPEEIVRILENAEDVRTVPRGDLPSDSFSASAVHLDGKDEVDIVVQGVGLLRGANITPFWIFRPNRGAYSLVLHTYAHDLIIKHSRTKEMLDIDSARISGVAVTITNFKFDGRRYVDVIHKTQPIK